VVRITARYTGVFFALKGSLASGLTFRHADGSAYGRVQAPVVADARTKVFLALRGLGFRESEARWVLEQATHVGAAQGVEAQVRVYLRLLPSGHRPRHKPRPTKRERWVERPLSSAPGAGKLFLELRQNGVGRGCQSAACTHGVM
jgi:hypothetical protein